MQFIKFSILSFVDAGEPSAVFFVRADALSENFLKYTLIGMIGGYIVSSLSIAGTGAVLAFMRDGHIEPKSLYLPVKVRYELRSHGHFEFGNCVFESNNNSATQHSIQREHVRRLDYCFLHRFDFCVYLWIGLHIDRELLHGHRLILQGMRTAVSINYHRLEGSQRWKFND